MITIYKIPFAGHTFFSIYITILSSVAYFFSLSISHTSYVSHWLCVTGERTFVGNKLVWFFRILNFSTPLKTNLTIHPCFEKGWLKKKKTTFTCTECTNSAHCFVHSKMSYWKATSTQVQVPVLWYLQFIPVEVQVEVVTCGANSGPQSEVSETSTGTCTSIDFYSRNHQEVKNWMTLQTVILFTVSTSTTKKTHTHKLLRSANITRSFYVREMLLCTV